MVAASLTMGTGEVAIGPLFPTWPPSCPPQETWELDGRRGLRTKYGMPTQP